MSSKVKLPLLEIDLPRLCGTSSAAVEFLSPHFEGLGRVTILLNARRMTVGTYSYADGLLSTFAKFGVETVLLRGATRDFTKIMLKMGKQKGIPVLHISSEEEFYATRVAAISNNAEG